ncbi:succinate dehydrogenase flavoprotein subunit [Penicillium atrosanguineum]|uniref:Domain found in IF2B/IF5-domain-containing protein n=1 Tax=Penicillium atrosanguineum TaxID=1132637 RepID=A0A9W9PLX7_9EURO|nr:succinate dehydrogenase flavoprotein subunit [Penicillium atrosanguineum]KAJ5296742.1 succinate dehydrogenase flavoprotein subunit [Penicillium atrosanguineum]KAJ5299501.1 domain found in IF2B/IF5-domain-containing protein [Penicillium atrosanguineum]
MADAAVEQKQRKSVAFDEGSVIMDTNGQIQDAPAAEKPAGMHPISKNPRVDSRTLDSGPANTSYPHTENDVDEVTEMFKGLSKKKKTKKSKDTEAGEGEETPAADGEFDPSALKKKKKKPKKETTDSEAKTEAGAATEEGDEKAEEPVPEGDPEAGTGIWQHDNTQAVPYSLLVSRFFSLIQSHHPDLLSSGTKSYKIPPPQCLREGNRRTIFANIADICKRIKRSDEHVTQFLFAELGTSGSVDGSRRLVIKGRFQQKGIESVLRRYIVEYVTCKTCRSPDTELNKGENRLYFVTCNSCGSRRSVAAIKTGFRGQVGRRKRTG